MPRTWKCGGCAQQNPRVKQRCPNCGRKRPAPRKTHHAALAELPYEWWVERFGERCGICGRGPSESRRLDRDHDHQTGQPRGLLCHLCNRNLGNRVDVEWLMAAATYLDEAGLPLAERTPCTKVSAAL